MQGHPHPAARDEPGTGNRKHRIRRGFTLIELVMGVALAAMLLFVTARVFGTAMVAREKLRASNTEIESLRRAFETISRDMHSAVVPPDDSGLQFGLSDTNAAGSAFGTNALQFASTVGEPLLAGRQASETVLVQYSVGEDPRTGKPALWRYATPYPVPEGSAPGASQDTQTTPLVPGVGGISYLFFSSEQQTWIESWEGQTGLPSAIRIDLYFGEGRRTTAEGDRQKQESWTFQLPAARFANDRAAEAALAESEAAGTGGTTP